MVEGVRFGFGFEFRFSTNALASLLVFATLGLLLLLLLLILLRVSTVIFLKRFLSKYFLVLGNHKTRKVTQIQFFILSNQIFSTAPLRLLSHHLPPNFPPINLIHSGSYNGALGTTVSRYPEIGCRIQRRTFADKAKVIFLIIT